ncbi:MAG: DUF1552 domain-containing protein [Polyangiaceae bacterium]
MSELGKRVGGLVSTGARSPSRRMMLRGLGGLALALPFLPSIEGESRAAPPVFPKRFVYVSLSCGEQPQNWWPTHPFAWKDLSGGAREADLTEAAGTGGLNRVLGPKFDALLPKMIFTRGLDFIGEHTGGHNPSAPLNGRRTGSAVTLDQILAKSAAVYPTSPALRSLHLMAKLDFQAEAGLSLAEEGNVFADAAPSVSWQRLFGGFVPDDPTSLLRRDLELGVLDRARGQYDRLVAHPRLSSEDRARLTQHAELVHDLQSRILATAAACDPPAEPLDPVMSEETGLDEVAQINIDLLTAALACDRTRVAVMQLCVGTDLRVNHHGVSHDSKFEQSARDEFAAIHGHYTDQLADLLTSLDSVIEDPTTGTTLLDNTCVLFSNEDGCCSDVHEGMAMPAVLAGGCGGYFDTGRFVDFRPVEIVDGQEVGEKFNHPAYGPVGPEFGDWRGRVYNSLLLSIMEAMGETPPGDGIGDYSNNIDGMFDETEMRKPLPHLQG